MATLLGSLTGGGSGDFFGDGDAFGSMWTAVATGTLETVKLTDPGITSSFTALRVGVYTNSGGNPATLLATSNVLNSNGGSTKTVTFTGGPTITSGTDYWLMVLANGGNFNTELATTGGYKGKSLGVGVSSFPAPWDTTGNSNNGSGGALPALGEGTLSASGGAGGYGFTRLGRHRGRYPAREHGFF